MKKVLILSMLLVLGIGILLSSPALAKEVRIKWGATSVRSSGYAHVVLYAKAVHQVYPKEISITVVETGGWVENLSRMQKGLLKLASVNPISAYQAFHGLYDFKDQKNPNIRMLLVSAFTPQTFIVAQNTGVTTIEGLKGVKMAWNPLTTSERLARMFLDALEIQPDFKLGGTASNLEAMKAGTVDAWSRPGFRDGAIMELGLSRPLNFISITDEHLKKYNAKYPAHGKGIMSPAGQYKGQEKPYYTLAFMEGDMVDKDVPADLVYKIMKAIYEKRMDMVKVDASRREGGFAEFPKLTMEYCDLYLHSGAVKFYREIGFKVPDKLIPPEMK